jgi:homogentisate phytyltransferase/homogentisate geranylgeranyltransferase
LEIGVNPLAMSLSHSSIGGGNVVAQLQVDLSDRPSIASFYQFIWKLFYLEYIVFPIACILAFI